MNDIQQVLTKWQLDTLLIPLLLVGVVLYALGWRRLGFSILIRKD